MLYNPNIFKGLKIWLLYITTQKKRAGFQMAFQIQTIIILIFHSSIPLANIYLPPLTCKIMEQRKDNSLLIMWFYLKEEIIIKTRMLDFLILETPSTVPRKQRCLFIECHLIQVMIALCSVLLGCFSFFGITKVSLNSRVTWFC